MIVSDTRGLALHVLHQPVKIVLRVGDAHDPDRSPIPESAGIQFSYGNVKTRAQAVFQATYDLSFVLERLGGFDVKLEREKGDHAVVSGQ